MMSWQKNGVKEMWYVIEADPGYTLNAGFNIGFMSESANTWITFNSGQLTDILDKRGRKSK